MIYIEISKEISLQTSSIATYMAIKYIQRQISLAVAGLNLQSSAIVSRYFSLTDA